MADLTTTYMGKKIKNPVVVGACDLTTDLEKIQRIEKAGAGAVVIKSLFEEQIQLERHQMEEEAAANDYLDAEMTDIFPDIEHSGPKEHLYWLEKAKQSAGIPVIASLNAVNPETWVEYAKMIEKTGVDGLELNLYTNTFDASKSGAAIEEEQIEIVKNVKKSVSLPVAVKLSAWYSSPVNFIRRLDEVGVQTFVLFNQFFQPDLDIEKEANTFPFHTSSQKDHRLPLRYAALLHGQTKAEICASTGILDGSHVVKMLLAGATNVQVVSALYQNGIFHIASILRQIEQWMDKKGYSSLEDFRGKLSTKGVEDPYAYHRTQYIRLLLKSNPTAS